MTTPHRKTPYPLLLFVKVEFAAVDFSVQGGDGAAVAFDLPTALELQIVDEGLEASLAEGGETIAFGQ